MAPHSSTLAWKIPWAEEPGRLQSMGSRRVGHDWATSLSLIGEGNGNPLQCSYLENPRDGGAWWAAVYGVAQSWTRLRRLSSSSSLFCVCSHAAARVKVNYAVFTLNWWPWRSSRSLFLSGNHTILGWSINFPTLLVDCFTSLLFQTTTSFFSI